MKAKSLSEFSGSDDLCYGIADKINTTYTRLRAIISEEANVRETLRALFFQQKEEANEAVRRAQEYLAFVNNGQARMKDVLRKEIEPTNLVCRCMNRFMRKLIFAPIIDYWCRIQRHIGCDSYWKSS